MATQITINDADLAALVQAAKATLAKIDALADKCDAALDAIKATADAGTQAIPQLQADVKVAADALRTFKFTGPLGMHGGSAS
jgi:uncharacterized protein (UPF0210 family)